MSYTFEQATNKAADFVHRQGIWLIQLTEATQREGKWVVTYQGILLFSNESYTVELNVETGEIVGFRRSIK
jgi:hypothetical protein